MRLIDAEEVLNDLMCLKHDKEYSDVDEAYDYGIDDCIDEVDGAEPVDAKPVIHAHWIRTAIDYGSKGYIRCSNCGADFSLPVHKMQGFYQRYCGACGARMDKNETD